MLMPLCTLLFLFFLRGSVFLHVTIAIFTCVCVFKTLRFPRYYLGQENIPGLFIFFTLQGTELSYG